MKFLSAFIVMFSLLSAGCAANSGKPSASRPSNTPPGTDVGTSFPGVNQPTTTTEAARANNATDDVPNSHR